MGKEASTKNLLADALSTAGADSVEALLGSLLSLDRELQIAVHRVAADIGGVSWSSEHVVAKDGGQSPEDLGEDWWLCPACADAFESKEAPSECQLCQEAFAAPTSPIAELDFGGRGKLWLSESGDYAHAEGPDCTFTSYSPALGKRVLDTDLAFSHPSLHEAIALGEDGEGRIFYRQGKILWSCLRGSSESNKEAEPPKLALARRLLWCLVSNSERKEFKALAEEGEMAEAREKKEDELAAAARQNEVIAEWRSRLLEPEGLAEAFVAHFDYLTASPMEKDWLAAIAARMDSVRLGPKRPELHFALRIDDEPCTLIATLPSRASGPHMPGLEEATTRHDSLALLLDDGTPIFSTAGLDEGGALEQHPCFIDDPEDKVALLLFDYESYAMLDGDGALHASEESCLSPLPTLPYPSLCLRFLAGAVLGGHYQKYLDA